MLDLLACPGLGLAHPASAVPKDSLEVKCNLR
jgi:hypothetical protein